MMEKIIYQVHQKETPCIVKFTERPVNHETFKGTCNFLNYPLEDISVLTAVICATHYVVLVVRHKAMKYVLTYLCLRCAVSLQAVMIFELKT